MATAMSSSMACGDPPVRYAYWQYASQTYTDNNAGDYRRYVPPREVTYDLDYFRAVPQELPRCEFCGRKQEAGKALCGGCGNVL